MEASVRRSPHSAGRSRPATSVSEAREARAQIGKKFDHAVANCSGTRLRRSDQTDLLQAAYLIVRNWRREHQSDRIEELLRRMSRGWIAPGSSLELVLLRSALPNLDPKRASKWAAAIELADHAGVSKRGFATFLKKQGGIEGAARTLARLRSAEGLLLVRDRP